MIKPATKQAMKLLMNGTIAMAKMEDAGMRIDEELLDKSIKETETTVLDLENEIKATKEFKLWTNKYGDKTKLTAKNQFGDVIFNLLGQKRNKYLSNIANDEEAFEHVNLPFVKLYMKYDKLKRALKTNLLGYKAEIQDGYIHPSFSLNIAESYRSACSNPNLQNVPVRMKDISKIIRSIFIPRKDHIFIESDYSAQEVRVSACYHKDPAFIKYILGSGDMHTDMAKEIYMLDEAPTKETRYAAKNMFVFPQFYGSFYAQCAPNLWDAMGKLNLTTLNNVKMKDHLRRKGIKLLGSCDFKQPPKKGTFEYHIKEVERHFWEDKFPVYDQFKRDWWDEYLREGGVNTLTGFKMEGVFRRNQILCDMIQGSSFHCLLWSIIQIQKIMEKRKMRSKIICQVHDSILGDVHKDEKDDYMELVHDVTTNQVQEHYKWIIVPLSIEFEIAEKNWFEKVPYKLHSN